ncbi:NAD(P)/FAD-dependent oxidoreductase [Nocardiopsis sp. NRRL B-16309]|uniref:NAD(P)/FAD-dependent oxidoreductase n=1 Tax=Nocardiopsis sp. NRRL B-16309 TaxID=1519494 RepID=UPI0006AF0C88|nr:FAD-dependent oxidoreductase [Nocardiopsis sp. NRRL B-16309]KOX12656.1 pyridine nucleotide-disulfide oxidoreductase [Nocardiopsis sp. NRRL B-16309]
MSHVIIVGAGHAGVQVASSLRAEGFTGAITLVGEEHEHPYQRPPLSKDFVAGQDEGPLLLRSERFFAENAIDIRRGVQATHIDRLGRSVALGNGDVLDYSALVLATGATGRHLPIPGTDLRGVRQLRSLGDARGLRKDVSKADSVVVVGAGFIGLEFAAAARKRGLDVTVLETAEKPMSRALTPYMSDHLTRAHRDMGTDLRLGEGLAGVLGHVGTVTAAVGTSGRAYPTDLVLLGIGVVPRDELARSAGLPVDNGIVVDQFLRTADSAIYAVGDCASFPGDAPYSRLRLESVQNANDQARHVAKAIAGHPAPYAALPLFWSNQGPLRLQIAGLAMPGDRTGVSGDLSGSRFSVFCFRDGRLAAVESLNNPKDHIAARRVLASQHPLTAEEVAEPGFSLQDHAKHLAPAN